MELRALHTMKTRLTAPGVWGKSRDQRYETVMFPVRWQHTVVVLAGVGDVFKGVRWNR
jgi:hypothetical protein